MSGKMVSLDEKHKKLLRQSQFFFYLTPDEVKELASIQSSSQQKFKMAFDERERLLNGGKFYVGPN